MTVTVPSERMAACMALLRRADGPLTAAAIAAALAIPGERETQRRRVREVIDALRLADKAWIVADTIQGYWLTTDEAVWRAWDESRAIEAKRTLGESHKRTKMLTDRGQGLLFVAAPRCGLG